MNVQAQKNSMIDIPLQLLGGLSPAQFMRRHWQKKPLLIRNAISQFRPLLTDKELLALAANENIESRLLQQNGKNWELTHGPLPKLPPLQQKGWTALLQGMDAQHEAVRALLDQFRFLPDARLDDVMISYASEGGGVGPHFDSYDVFLLQAAGRRRWQISAQDDLRLRKNLPLKILQKFVPEEEFVLEPGDMLYLPPHYAHDGVALDAGCQTYSIGFYAPSNAQLAATLFQRLAEVAEDEIELPLLYADAQQKPVTESAAIPAGLQKFALQSVQNLIKNPQLLHEMLGEHLSEPKENIWFEAQPSPKNWQVLTLARASKMLYDQDCVYCNGESWNAAGKDAALLQKLANARHIQRSDFDKASASAQQLLGEWLAQGWVVAR